MTAKVSSSLVMMLSLRLVCLAYLFNLVEDFPDFGRISVLHEGDTEFFVRKLKVGL